MLEFTFLSQYHTGYQEQMSHWPEQPVNVIINWLKSHNASWTVADFGCGKINLTVLQLVLLASFLLFTSFYLPGTIMRILFNYSYFPGNAAVAKNVKNKVFSIDLVSDDPSVIACDMAHVSTGCKLHNTFLMLCIANYLFFMLVC